MATTQGWQVLPFCWFILGGLAAVGGCGFDQVAASEATNADLVSLCITLFPCVSILSAVS